MRPSAENVVTMATDSGMGPTMPRYAVHVQQLRWFTLATASATLPCPSKGCPSARSGGACDDQPRNWAATPQRSQQPHQRHAVGPRSSFTLGAARAQRRAQAASLPIRSGTAAPEGTATDTPGAHQSPRSTSASATGHHRLRYSVAGENQVKPPPGLYARRRRVHPADGLRCGQTRRPRLCIGLRQIGQDGACGHGGDTAQQTQDQGLRDATIDCNAAAAQAGYWQRRCAAL